MCKTKRAFTVSVEGNIGSGKTTFLSTFCPESDDVDVLPEPVERWQNVRGHNLLALMYEDPARYAFLFQMYVQLTMLEYHERPCAKIAKILERSLPRMCFIEQLRSRGNISDAEHAVITEWNDYLLPQHDLAVDVVIYLRTSPEVAYNRILARNREEEAQITFEQVSQLHELHEEWLIEKRLFQTPSKVIVIEADGDLESLQPIYEEHKNNILEMAIEAMEQSLPVLDE